MNRSFQPIASTACAPATKPSDPLFVSMFSAAQNINAVQCPSGVWPAAIEQSLWTLPKRCLFRNERMSVVLAGLQPGEVLTLGPWPHACLLVVTFGALSLTIAGLEFGLAETDSMVLVPHERHEAHAPRLVDFLVLNLRPPLANVSTSLDENKTERRNIVGTASHVYEFDAHV